MLPAKMLTIGKGLICTVFLTVLNGCNEENQSSAPTAADFEKMYDVTLVNPNAARNPTKVTHVDCASAGNREWRCEIAFEKFLTGPPGQLALDGYYETTVRGIYGPRADGKFSVLRNYEFLGQRRIRPGR